MSLAVRKNRMIVLAQAWLLEYFSDGRTYKPSDFDEDFLGKVGATYTDMSKGVVGFSEYAWNRTPFFAALGDLVDSGKVIYWIDYDEGSHNYKIANRDQINT